jgi:hypothetical protein
MEKEIMDSYPEQLFDLLDRPIAFHRGLKRVINSANTALMLSQAIYWSRRTEDGWFYKTQVEWEEETFLTRSEQELARKYLRTQNFWHEERRGCPAKLYFRVDFQALLKALAKPETPEKSSMSETDIQECEILHTGVRDSANKSTKSRSHTIYTKNTYKDYSIENQEPHTEDFSDFVNLWNQEKNQIWATCKILSQARIGLLRKLIKDAGSRAAALEILEKACKYGREDKFWGEKRMTLENVLRHAVELSERCLETPNGHVITQAEFQMAAQQQKADELAQRLRKKFGFPQENN